VITSLRRLNITAAASAADWQYQGILRIVWFVAAFGYRNADCNYSAVRMSDYRPNSFP